MGTFQDTYKITSADRADKGVTGLPDTPGLSTGDMQARFDSLGNLSIDKFNALVDCVGGGITNDDTKLPTMADIVAYVVAMGGGDMNKVLQESVCNNSSHCGIYRRGSNDMGRDKDHASYGNYLRQRR